MDTLGACAQIMDWDGNLRWAFVTDPYIEGKICSSIDADNKINYTDIIVGEQYLDMISPWLRPDDEDKVCFFGQQGGAGDNTVQEIFKVMEECALTKAYLIVDDKNEIHSWNCRVEREGDLLHIYPYETIVETIHVNLGTEAKIKAHLAKQTITENYKAGMHWVGKKPYLLK